MRKERFEAYAGQEPYLYFACCEQDIPQALPLLNRLRQRGCRVWLPQNGKETMETRRRDAARRQNAALVVLVLTEAALKDEDGVKSAAGFCQSRGQALIVLDAAASDALSTGLNGKETHLRLADFADASEAEAALVRCEGFTQALIGLPTDEKKAPKWKKLLLIPLILAVLVLGMLAFMQMRTEAPADEVVFSDAVIAESVRAAVGSPVTRESVEKLTALRLTGVPDAFEELDRLPALTWLEIPQECVSGAAENALYDRYTVVIVGGEP